MDKRDEVALARIGDVNMDKIAAVMDERRQNIIELFDTLDEKADNDKLTDWEYDFYESVQQYFVKHNKLSDKQYERLLQIQVKYE